MYERGRATTTPTKPEGETVAWLNDSGFGVSGRLTFLSWKTNKQRIVVFHFVCLLVFPDASAYSGFRCTCSPRCMESERVLFGHVEAADAKTEFKNAFFVKN